MRVVAGAENTGRLVQGDVDFAFDDDRLAGKRNAVHRGVDSRAENSNRQAVDGNVAALNERFAAAPRANTGLGEKLLETDEHYSGLVFGRPNTRWPSFQRPCFLSTSMRSNRFMTLRFALMVLLPLRLRC